MTDVIQNITENVNNSKIENSINEMSNIKNITEKVNDINNKINSKVENKNSINEINQKINDINMENNLELPVIRNITVNKKDLLEEKGILDPEGKALNPLTGEPYQNIYKDLNKEGSKTYSEWGKIWSAYPVYKQREEMIKTLYEKQCVLITAGTGSGKTVLVPKYLLHVLNYQGRIAITIPRRTATKEGTAFSAMLLDTPIGEQVGFKIKGEKTVGPNTKLIYTTDGSIIAKLRNDPLLSDLDGLIIDEAHERNLNIDLILLYMKKILKERPTFKFVIMSATVDPSTFLNYYKEFDIKHIEGFSGTSEPIEEFFLPPGKEIYKMDKSGEVMDKTYVDKVVEIITEKIIFPGKDGDILVLFPSKTDCLNSCILLDKKIKDKMKKEPEFVSKPFCVQLTSKEGSSESSPRTYALNSRYKNLGEGHTRRIVMATEVAESAITLKGDDLLWVIDTGLSMQMKYYPGEAVQALEKKYISKASHTQRKGRVGRTAPGTCYNIFTEKEYKNNFPEYATPPILKEDFLPNLLPFFNTPEITHVDLPFVYPDTGTTSLNSFLKQLISPPKEEFVSNAIERLYLLGGITVDSAKKGILTPFGKALDTFRDIDPIMAATVIHAHNYKLGYEVADAIALLQVLDHKSKDIFMQLKRKAPNNSPETKELFKEYEKQIGKIISPYGAFVTFYKIMSEYIYRKYNIVWEKGRRTLASKETDDAATWAKNHYINKKKIENALNISKNINRNLSRVIYLYRQDNPNASKYLFTDDEPTIHDKKEDNLMQIFTKGFVSNVVKKVGNNSYITCFPKIQTVGKPDKYGLFNYIKVKPGTGVYSKYWKMQGNMNCLSFSKVPVKVIDGLKKDRIAILDKCTKDMPKSSPNKYQQGKRGKQGKQKKWGKKGKRR